ncbi:MAG: hypothetical protein A4E53_04129 [Pelotomaculum sp. PtaB.Bin104]|nr:MAG: hypothetical protein A4E53_04129 [Pelotomaculum sp. PtaB.Bin104]
MRWLRLIVLLIVLLLFVGCNSRGFNTFKELSVSDKDIPQYEIASEISDQSPPTKIWITVNAANIDENQAKQIQADIIDKKIKENESTVKGIMVVVKVKKEQFTAQYVKDEATQNLMASNTEAPKKFPAIIYSKSSQ